MRFRPVLRQEKFLLLCQWLVLIYAVCGIAYEYVDGMKDFTSFSLYIAVLFGFIHICIVRRVYLDCYNICMVLLAAFIYFMAYSNSQSANKTAYSFVTAMILAFIVSNLVYIDRRMAFKLLVASVIGALLLCIEIVKSYNGISALISYASNTKFIHRVGTTITNENTIGLFMANGILCIAVILASRKNMKKRYRILLLLAVVPLLVILLFTGSRKALVFVAAGLFLFWLIYSQKSVWWKKLFYIILIAIGVLLMYLIISKISVFNAIKSRIDTTIASVFSGSSGDAGDSNRYTMIKNGMEAFYLHPVFGNGTAYSNELFGTYSHNNYVELLMNYGIIGFLLYYVPFAVLLVRISKLVEKGDAIAIYFTVYILTELVMGFLLVYYYNRAIQMIIAAAWGYVASVEKEEKMKLYIEKISDIVRAPSKVN